MFEYDLFLSYQEVDGEKARAVKAKAQERGLNVFMAQEVIGPGDDWENKIREALLESRELAFIATKESVQRPWVIQECGAHWLLGRVVTPIIVDCKREDIAAQFLKYQAVDYEDVDYFLKTVVHRKQASSFGPAGPINYYLSKHPEGVQETLVAGTVNTSPFGTIKLFQEAQKRMFIAGQNLYFLLVGNANETKRLLKDFLSAGEGRQVEFLICDPDYAPGVTTWTDISDAARYKRDLDQAVKNLEQWVREFRGLGLQLSARATELVAITATFVDPESPDGRLYLLLNTWQQRAGIKACFFVSRSVHQPIFLNYWENYNLAFMRGRPIGEEGVT